MILSELDSPAAWLFRLRGGLTTISRQSVYLRDINWMVSLKERVTGIFYPLFRLFHALQAHALHARLSQHVPHGADIGRVVHALVPVDIEGIASHMLRKMPAFMRMLGSEVNSLR